MKDPKKEKNNRKTGGNYEQAAGFYLEQHGYQILQYNYRCRIGEIDIVAKEGENLVFCEVQDWSWQGESAGSCRCKKAEKDISGSNVLSDGTSY